MAYKQEVERALIPETYKQWNFVVEAVKINVEADMYEVQACVILSAVRRRYLVALCHAFTNMHSTISETNFKVHARKLPLKHWRKLFKIYVNTHQFKSVGPSVCP